MSCTIQMLIIGFKTVLNKSPYILIPMSYYIV